MHCFQTKSASFQHAHTTASLQPHQRRRWSSLIFGTLAVLLLLVAAPMDVFAIGLNDLNQVPTGNYFFTADSETFQGYVRRDPDQIGWLLVGRGREGWEFDADGQGAVADVRQNLGTTAAFTPAAYRNAIINDLITDAGIDLTNIEIRLRRAANTTGTAYQEVRWRPTSETAWRWNLDSPASTGIAVELDVFASVLGGAFSDATSGTYDGNALGAGNNHERIFTWLWGSHGQKGFSYGSSISGVNNDDPNTFLWEFTTENHALPYTEVFIRNLDAPPLFDPNAIPEPSTLALAALGLLGIMLQRRRRSRASRGDSPGA